MFGINQLESVVLQRMPHVLYMQSMEEYSQKSIFFLLMDAKVKIKTVFQEDCVENLHVVHVFTVASTS